MFQNGIVEKIKNSFSFCHVVDFKYYLACFTCLNLETQKRKK